ncbi:unnamed protein product [Vitrella brassicaformis CCMP3155]|uniref:Uncharacterized protein n=1 Tax=Vitrella brassicaformis (strain CCMP3155) TaxID=1169540 RepID=A0A0G4FD35_VITBC|nr:unnamed protein product [Vitrella brassicaformis CCMP3155]|eukprot:CEM11158.1 unnamed protein product [Vitrella brassicaformis CCMP3155]
MAASEASMAASEPSSAGSSVRDFHDLTDVLPSICGFFTLGELAVFARCCSATDRVARLEIVWAPRLRLTQFAFPDFSLRGSEALSKNPWRFAHVKHKLRLGLAAYERRDFALAIRHYAVAHQIAPTNETVLTRKADAHYANDEKDVAQELYRRAIEVNEDSSYGWNGRSLEEGIPEAEAISRLERATRLNPSNSYALSNLASKLVSRDSSRALEVLNRALALNPRLFYARHTKAVLLARRGQLSEAIRVLDEQVEVHPDDQTGRHLRDDLHRMEVMRRLVHQAIAQPFMPPPPQPVGNGGDAEGDGGAGTGEMEDVD